MGAGVRFAFDDHLLDPDRRELTRGSEPVAVGPQVFDLLMYLVRNRSQVVSKDDLIDAVWGGRIVSESTLTSHINALRKAIGDSGEEQRLIRTIARKGYRFVGDVREVDALESARTRRRRSSRMAPALTLPDRPSIAVLPFLNLSGDPEQDYFVDGVVEDIIAALSRMSWLFVIARNSSFTYKGRAVDVKQVGRELGVRYILEGSLRQAANRVRITGQLVDATTGHQSLVGALRRQDRRHLRAAGPADREMSSARSRRNWSAPRSSAPSTSRPKASTPTTTTCALCGNSGKLPGARSTRRCRCSTKAIRARSGIRVGLCHGRLVPFLAQGQSLDDRS